MNVVGGEAPFILKEASEEKMYYRGLQCIQESIDSLLCVWLTTEANLKFWTMGGSER